MAEEAEPTFEKILTSFGSTVKSKRLEFGLSQEELAHRMGVSDATVGRVENGKQNWTQDFLQEAAKVFGCHWLDLLPLEEDRARARDMLRLIA